MSQLTTLFFKGLAALLPIVITVAVLYWLGTGAEEWLGGVLKQVLEVTAPGTRYVPGMGLAAGLLLVLFVGVLVNNRIGAALLHLAEQQVLRLPLAKTIFNGVRDVMGFFTAARENRQGGRVVLIEAAPGVKLMGFVTQEHASLPGADAGGEALASVYVPVSYQIGGYTVYVPRARLETVNLSVEHAMRLTITAGVSGHGNAKPGTAE